MGKQQVGAAGYLRPQDPEVNGASAGQVLQGVGDCAADKGLRKHHLLGQRKNHQVRMRSKQNAELHHQVVIFHLETTMQCSDFDFFLKYSIFLPFD